MKHKLIIVEGLPGAGKSTVAENIHRRLQQNGRIGSLFNEGNLDHPADYESVACMSVEEFTNIIKKHGLKDELSRYVEFKKGNYFASLGKMWRDGVYQDLCESMLEYKIYDKLPWEREMPIMLDYWREFVEERFDKEDYTVLECCFLQNTTCEMMARFNKREDEIYDHIQKINEIISPLNPIVIYLSLSNVEARLNEIIPTRPIEWIEGVIRYHTKQGYGLENQLEGFEGLITFYIKRQEIEKRILNRLNITKLILYDPFNDWDECYSKILNWFN
jgi:hypothetical protein